jgi:hypothetical protein
MGLAAVLGQNYKLPQAASQLQPQGTGAPQEPGLPADISTPAGALFDTDESMRSYYDKVGELDKN